MNEKARLEEIISILNKHHFIKDKSPENIRIIFEELGPSFIKIGQILSSRNDYLPNNYCQEFKKLLSDVQPVPFEEIVDILNDAYGDYKKVFKHIDHKPIGSASIAQTYRATLKKGDEVAVKIAHKNIQEMINLDLKLLKRIVNIFHLDQIFSNITNINNLIDELRISMNLEADFLNEAKNINLFNQYNKDIKYLKLLNVYEDLTKKNVLVMEYIDGFDIGDIKALLDNGYDLHEISEKLANNYIKQAITDGYYHADPHASNIKIVNGKICYLDFGMMGTLSKNSRYYLEQCIVNIITNNYKEIAHILTLINTNNNDIDNMQLITDIKKVLEKNKTTGIASINIKMFVNDMYKMLNDNHIILPNDMMMLIRGIVVIAGLLEQICPSISLALVFKNYYKTNINKLISKEDLDKNLIKLSLNYNNLIDIPTYALETLKGINNNDLRFNVELSNSNKLSSVISTMIHQLIIALIDLGLIIGLAIISLKNDYLNPFFYIYLISSILCTLYLIYRIIENKICRSKRQH